MGTLLAGWWSAIWPNLAASALWATPAFVLHHKTLKRHIDRRHNELTTRIDSGSTQREEA